MRYHEYFDYILKMLKLWVQAIGDPKQFLQAGFTPTDDRVAMGMEFYAWVVLVSILLGAPLIVAQKGDIADKTRMAANCVFTILAMSVLALTWHFSFWLLGGQSSLTGTFLAYVYGASPYVPLIGLAMWILASAYPKHLIVFLVSPTMAKQGMKRAINDPDTATSMVILGGLIIWGIFFWSTFVLLRCFKYVHMLSGWRLVGAVMLSFVLGIPVWAVVKRMETLLHADEEVAKTLTRRIIEEMWNAGKLEVASELFAENSVLHDPTIPDTKPGPEGVKEFVRLYRAAFPDLYMEIDDQVGEGNLVVTRWTLTGTQQGPFVDLPATGKPVVVKGITIYRFHKGEVAEGWMNWDALGLLQQVSVSGEATAESTGRQLMEQSGGMEPVPAPA